MKTPEEAYKEWCGKSHIENSSHLVHDSEECIEFAKYYVKMVVDFDELLTQENE